MATDLCIREVWNDNLEQEFALIRGVIDDYPYIAMDTHFPGVVVHPMGLFNNYSDYNYASFKGNINLLKLIQLGLTLSDEDGNIPTLGTGNPCVWQFNFREFNVSQDAYASESIEMLRQRGIDFEKNFEKGVDAHRFGELLCTSGAVLNDNIHWVTFQGRYDFGYLLKLLMREDLPNSQSDFFQLINLYFQNFYDVKYLMRFCDNNLDCGLNKLAETLDVERLGVSHQAGSDSLLTCNVFKKLKDIYFNGNAEKYAGVLHGLGVAKGEN